MSEDTFEVVTEIKYRPEIKEQTDEEARRGLLEGEEYMVLEIQVIGMVEICGGADSLMFDFLAACNQNAVTSPWMKEKMSLLSDICEGTVMVLTRKMRARLIQQIQKREGQEICLYRLSAWLSMGDDGSQRWSIRDQIDPVFEHEDRTVVKRAEEARRLAEKAMEHKAG